MPKKDRQALRTTPGFTGPFKGDPQPGTLFDKRTVEKSGDEIGPRGYSLNRSRQFQNMLQERPGFGKRPGEVSLHVEYRGREPGEYDSIAQGANEERGTTPAVLPNQHPYGPSYLGDAHNRPVEMDEYEKKGASYYSSHNELAKSMGRGRSKMIDTLARSTMPAEQLKGLDGITIRPKDPEFAGSYHSNDSNKEIRLNVTDSSQGDIDNGHVKHPEQRGPVDTDSELTLLHEIGHHASFEANGGTRPYRSNSEQAAEEGRADRYSTTHFRQDPRGIGWQFRTDPREHTYGGRGSVPGWNTGDAPRTRQIYEHQLGKENVAPPKVDYSSSALDSRTNIEARTHPMLDEGPKGGHVFTNTISDSAVNRAYGGFHKPGHFSDEEKRATIYREGARKTSAQQGHTQQAEQTERKARWGSQNRNLNGEQFSEPPQPSGSSPLWKPKTS